MLLVPYYCLLLKRFKFINPRGGCGLLQLYFTDYLSRISVGLEYNRLIIGNYLTFYSFTFFILILTL